MQHTEKYQLNLIEKTDAFSPDALNANTQKVEAALSAHEAAVGAENAALAARVTALEGKKIALVVYTGDGEKERVLRPGFTPAAALYFNPYRGLTFMNQADGTSGGIGLVEGGILVTNNLPNYQYNTENKEYRIILFN